MALLKVSGKIPSERERFIKCVIGTTRASRQDLSNLVGMISRGQDESVELSMILRISSVIAGAKLDMIGVDAERKIPEVQNI